MGVATNSDEYVPTSRPTSSAIANSWSVTAPSTNRPTTSTASTGITEVIVVFTDRISTWLSEYEVTSV